MTNHQHTHPDSTVAKPNVLLRIKIGDTMYETLSTNLHYPDFMDRIREIWPRWDDSNNWIRYSYRTQQEQDSNTTQYYHLLGSRSWDAMWWQVGRAGYEYVDIEIMQRSNITSPEASSASSPPAYTEKEKV